MPLYGSYWLYNRDMPAPGWPERLRTWLAKHGNMPETIWVRVGEDRDDIVRMMYDDCVNHGFSVRAFIDMAEGGLGDTSHLSSLDEALAVVADAPRWRMSFFGGVTLSTRIIEHLVAHRPTPHDLVPCNLSFEGGGLRPISCYKNDEAVLHDLCRFRIGLNGEGTTIDAPLLLRNLTSTPGFAEWRADAEDCFGPLREYLFYYGL